MTRQMQHLTSLVFTLTRTHTTAEHSQKAENLPELEDESESSGVDSKIGGSITLSTIKNRPPLKQFEIWRPIDYGSDLDK